MTLTHGRIVLSPISARPRYAWSQVRGVQGLAAVHASLTQDPEPCAVLWRPDVRTVASADAEALLEYVHDARAA